MCEVIACSQTIDIYHSSLGREEVASLQRLWLLSKKWVSLVIQIIAQSAIGFFYLWADYLSLPFQNFFIISILTESISIPFEWAEKTIVSTNNSKKKL